MTNGKMLTRHGVREKVRVMLFAVVFFVLLGLPNHMWAQAVNSDSNPLWVQVEDPQNEVTNRPKSSSQHFGFVFQEDQIKSNSRLPYGQSLLMAGLRYESDLFVESPLRYQVTAMLGESRVIHEFSAELSTILPIQTRYFGLELGLKRLWDFSTKFRVGPEVRIRSQIGYQFAPQTQFPSRESYGNFLGIDLNAQYFLSESLGTEFELGFDQFFESQVRLGVFRKW
jgi:hypothetical protein